jgi:NADH-quinone oxidoreductase subunit L
VLASVYSTSKILWAVGVITAILTAYYMSRLFVLTFSGTERFREVTHDHDPHESPTVMVAPLVILAILSFVGGVVNLPWIHHDSLAGFLAGAISPLPVAATSSTTALWVLAAVDVAAALLGLAAAVTVWRTASPSPRWEPAFLEKVWHWDDLYDATIGRPATALARLGGDVIEPVVIDGAVTAVAVSARRSGEGLRKLQSGFLRHYALATVLGLAVMVIFLLTRSW